ncbi:MAG TPA: sigma-70 family RNA polymerase sigma factor [Opitutaceae bacterium]|nr:sigma-70 family RNA polymerase sigma factor [Opitutaceae bacterium]
MSDDSALLQRYVDGSEAAFTELVQRHLPLVYTAALRRVGGDRQAAEEVTQTVFTRCAQKAPALRYHPALSGWLHQSTRYAATDALRAKHRRERVEQLISMNSDAVSTDNRDASWTEIRPVIDSFLDRLAERDRHAIALRFFDGLSFAEIGAKLRLSEDATRMRVDRALEKLRGTLAHRGIHSTAAALGAALAQHAALAAPAGLGPTVSASALAAASGTSALTLGSLFLMNKVQSVVLGAVVAVGLTTVAVETRATVRLRHEIDATSHALSQDGSAPSTTIASVAVSDPAATEELSRLRARIAELRARPDGVIDSEIIPRSKWKAVGRATPEAAFETFTWAVMTHHNDELAKSFFFGDKAKAQADAIFASLQPELRAKYGTPERLLAPFVFEVPINHRAEVNRLDAMQVIELLEGDSPDQVTVRYWYHFSDGTGQVATLPFTRFGDEWRMGTRGMGFVLPKRSPEFIQKASETADFPEAGTTP